MDSSNLPPSTPLSELIEAVATAKDFLRRYGEVYVSNRMAELEVRLIDGDYSAIQSALNEARGGMGSLNDRVLSRLNGDNVEQREEEDLNQQLRSIVELIGARSEAALRLGFR